MEPKRSCCSRETCCGMRVETAGFIFAIINAIIVTSVTLCCLVFFGMMLDTRLDPDKMQEQGSNSLLDILSIQSVVCLVGAAIAEVFAVLLCVGIAKKRPRYVMAYLVYGVLTEILCVIGIVCFICMEWGDWDLIFYGGALTLGVCVIYALLLLLVKQTYIVLSDPSPGGHRKLVSNQYDS